MRVFQTSHQSNHQQKVRRKLKRLVSWAQCLSYKCSNEPQKIPVAGNEVCDESSIVGLPKQPPSKAQEINSPLKQTNEPLINNETTTTPLSPRKGNWKRIAKAQGKKIQIINPDTQNLMGLSGFKRINKLDFSEENEGKPMKKHCDSYYSNTHDTTEISAVAAKQHHWEPWISCVGTAGELGTPRQFMHSAIMYDVGIPD